MAVIKHILKMPLPVIHCKRTLFRWVNLMFNAVDMDRVKQFGPDRTCAEWILRNGGAVKWVNSSAALTDYNDLPKEGTTLRLQEIDATNSSIMYNGFEHFKGCEHITKVTLHKCSYLDDQALSELRYLKRTLVHLQVSSCPNIRDTGLLHLNVLEKLKQLILFDLISVKKRDETVQALKSSLPQCTIQFM